MARTLNHYDALGYAEGWNLVANPRTATNLMEVKAGIENELKHAVRFNPRDQSIMRRTLLAKLAGFNNALSTLMKNELTLDIAITDPETDGGGV